MNISVTAAGGTIGAGWYNVGANGLPGTLGAQIGTFNATTTGVKSAGTGATTTIPAGWIYFCLRLDTVNVGVHAVSQGGNALSIGGTSAFANDNPWLLRYNPANGFTLPATAETPNAEIGGSSAAPVISYRVSALP